VRRRERERRLALVVDDPHARAAVGQERRDVVAAARDGEEVRDDSEVIASREGSRPLVTCYVAERVSAW
jgi:hypothetical protein